MSESSEYRLSDDIAAHRRCYRSPGVGAPFVMLIDLPSRNRGDGLLLGRFYSSLLETEAEVAEMEDWLMQSRSEAVVPDRFDHCPSQVRGRGVLIAQYSSPESGWPWLVVCRWPTVSAGALARGCYSVEAFWSAEEMTDLCAELLAQLGRERVLDVRMIGADQLGSGGRA